MISSDCTRTWAATVHEHGETLFRVGDRGLHMVSIGEFGDHIAEFTRHGSIHHALSAGDTLSDQGVPLLESFPVVFGSYAVSDIPGFRFLLIVVAVGIGVIASKFLVRLIGRPVAQRVSRQSVAQTIVRGVRVGTIVIALLVGLWAAGVQLPDFIVAGAVFSAVVGVILAPLIGNFINGVFILADQPFEIGDMIELEDGTTGFVDDITIRYTKIFTLDNTFLVVPNGNMRDRDVTNFSAEDERTRRSIDILVTYESDIDVARRQIQQAARDCEAVIDGGPDIRVGVARYTASPDCRIHEFGDNGVLLRLRYWVKKPYKLAKVQSDVNERIRARFADVDVTMAYPHRHLVFDETSGVARVSGQDTMGSVGADSSSDSSESATDAAASLRSVEGSESSTDGSAPADTTRSLADDDSPTDREE